MIRMDRLRDNVQRVRERIAAACARAGRNSDDVTLVVVTKSAPVEAIAPLAGLGIGDIGENRAVEGLERIGGLRGFRRHMVGRLQANKVKKALQWTDVLHSLDRPSLMEEIRKHNKRLSVFVQLNVSGEASKGGFRPEEAESAVNEAKKSLDVAGLMTMAPEGADARPFFRTLRETAGRLGVAGLSMGMSHDFEVAVEEGATCVRVGTAIFEGVFEYNT